MFYFWNNTLMENREEQISKFIPNNRFWKKTEQSLLALAALGKFAKAPVPRSYAPESLK